MSYPHNYRSGLRFLVMAAQQRRLIESTQWRAALGTLVRTVAALSMQAVGLAAAVPTHMGPSIMGSMHAPTPRSKTLRKMPLSRNS